MINAVTPSKSVVVLRKLVCTILMLRQSLHDGNDKRLTYNVHIQYSASVVLNTHTPWLTYSHVHKHLLLSGAAVRPAVQLLQIHGSPHVASFQCTIYILFTSSIIYRYYLSSASLLRIRTKTNRKNNSSAPSRSCYITRKHP